MHAAFQRFPTVVPEWLGVEEDRAQYSDRTSYLIIERI